MYNIPCSSFAALPDCIFSRMFQKEHSISAHKKTDSFRSGTCNSELFNVQFRAFQCYSYFFSMGH